MPNLQILAANPTFGSKLGQALGQGSSEGLQQQLASFQEQKKQSKLASQLENLGIPGALAGQDPRIIQQYMKMQQQNNLLNLLGNPPRSASPSEINNHPGISQKAPLDEEVDNNEIISAKEFTPEGKEVSQEEVEFSSVVNPALGRSKAQERKLQLQETQEVKKRNLAKYDEATTKLEGLKEQRMGLKQLESLSNEIGAAQRKGFFDRLFRTYRFDPESGGFTRIGKATSTPQEERYIKLLADQTKNIKNDFGSRVTNLDLQVFMRRFPDLMMTAEGRKEILGTLNDYNKAKQIYNKEMKRQIKITKGKADPYELEEAVEKNIKPQIKEIKKRIAERGFSTKGQKLDAQGTTIQMRDPSGNIRRVSKEDVKKAKDAGYKLVK